MNIRADFDAGPLSWVKGEIDLAMQRGLDSLREFAANTGDLAKIKLARAQLHQAHGALQIVGLDGVTRVSEELENLVADLEQGTEARTQQNFALAAEAFSAIATYLDTLIAGSPNQPLRLFPLYRRLLAARGQGDAEPVDLYFPDLSGRPPPRDKPPVTLAPEGHDKHYREQRGRFQRGLLKWMQEDESGTGDMRAAVEATELVQGLNQQRAFWWVSLAFFDALAAKALPADAGVKRLCNRIDQEFRRLVEGSQNVAGRLLREALYQVARARPATPHIAAVQAAYKLERTPQNDAGVLQAPAALSAACEALAQAKDAWNKYASGNVSSLSAFRSAIGVLRDRSAELDNPDVAALALEIAELAAWLSSHTSNMSEAIALEVATALLLLENALANFVSLGADFVKQAQFVCARLKACVLGKLLRTAPTIPLLDEMSRKAQERLVLNQVVSEMQTNLRSIEQVLDAFYRDPAKRGELATLGGPLRQVKGALDMLGETRARDSLGECEAQIGRFAQTDSAAAQEDFERIAQTLSGLGFYIEALGAGNADFDAAMRPIDARRRASEDGEAAAPRALSVLDAAPDEVSRAPAIAQVLEDAAAVSETPALSPGTAGLLDASAEKVDAELLAIYLEEAEEILASIRDHLESVRSHAANKPALTAIRRAFHTLKGSGRMVGLARLGEAAWAVEQTMNLWLQDERAATPDLVQLVSVARDYFADNVARLKEGGISSDAAPLIEIAEDVRRGASLIARAAPAAPVAPAASGGTAAPAGQAIAPKDERLAAGEPSKSLFDLFAVEAKAHLQTMAREHEVLAQQAVISDALIRAAHTLAGISATVGVHAVRDLGYALEHALQALSAGTLSEAEERLVGDTIDALSSMVELALSKTALRERSDLIDRLRRAAAPVLVESFGPAMLPEEEGALAREPEAIQDLTEAEAPLGQPAQTAVEPLAAAPTADVQSEKAAVERRQRRMRDDPDPQLMPLFLEEANDLMPAIGSALREWRSSPDDARIGQWFQRSLHTLKGGARMAGAMGIGELTHQMETRAEQARSLKTLPAALFDALDTSYDRLGLLFETLRSGTASQAVGPEALPPAMQRDDPAPQDGLLPAAMLRVRAEIVDRLVNQAGEVSIARSRIEGEMRALRTAMQELTDNVVRLRSQLREIEIQAESQMQSRMQELRDAKQGFDPLEFDRFTGFQELTRLMAESVNDVQTVHQNLIHAVDQTEAGLLAQARLNRDLQQNLMRVRMVPFSSLSERLYRIVRQSAKELGKRVNLDIRGAQVDLDRSVLERITAPLEHLLRNAVMHGVELPAERVAAAKPEFGEIRLEISQEGNEIRLALSDDGRGLDIASIRGKAVSTGLLDKDRVLSDAEIADFIFLPGFTTATLITEIAGRGVGMDVVRAEVASLGGRIELEFNAGKGTRFIIYLPLTLAVTQVVLVKGAGRIYAIPTVMVEQVRQLKAEQLALAYSDRQAEWQSRRYPFHFLPHLLGAAEHAEPRRYAPVLFLRSGSNAIALHVDEIRGSNQEIVVKAIGPQLQRIAGITGATVLGSGEIVLILNPVLLALRELVAVAPGAPLAPGVAPVTPAARPTVMVVDDSLTVRKITGRLLARESYEVVVAKDGVDAMEKLQDCVPDVMLVDIEMPRMDGFDLTRNVRADPRLAAVPIIIISSRTAEKHRTYAKEIGASAFLGKPYQEDELLGRIAGFIEARKTA